MTVFKCAECGVENVADLDDKQPLWMTVRRELGFYQGSAFFHRRIQLHFEGSDDYLRFCSLECKETGLRPEALRERLGKRLLREAEAARTKAAAEEA